MEETKKESSKMFTMRMDDTTKQKLVDLSSNEVYKYNNSALVKALIEAEHLKTLKSDVK